MLDESLSTLHHKRRSARRRDVKATVGPVLCSLALAYVMAIALVGILAG